MKVLVVVPFHALDFLLDNPLYDELAYFHAS